MRQYVHRREQDVSGRTRECDDGPEEPGTGTIPDSMHFVASTRGRTYYWVGCSGWKSLAPANLRFFRTAADARAAGLRVSTQARCAGPAAVQGPADTTAAPAGTMLSIESEIQQQSRYGRRLRVTSALEMITM